MALLSMAWRDQYGWMYRILQLREQEMSKKQGE
jgi:hypothetical protein